MAAAARSRQRRGADFHISTFLRRRHNAVAPSGRQRDVPLEAGHTPAAPPPQGPPAPPARRSPHLANEVVVGLMSARLWRLNSVSSFSLMRVFTPSPKSVPSGSTSPAPPSGLR